MNDWLDNFQMTGATLNEGEKMLMRFAISKERQRIIKLLLASQSVTHSDIWLWQDGQYRITLGELIALIKGENK